MVVPCAAEGVTQPTVRTVVPVAAGPEALGVVGAEAEPEAEDPAAVDGAAVVEAQADGVAEALPAAGAKPFSLAEVERVGVAVADSLAVADGWRRRSRPASGWRPGSPPPWPIPRPARWPERCP